jgi:hypothetical protein
MSFPDDSTWMVSSGDRGTFALYVRDALGINSPTADAIPLLSPAVPLALRWTSTRSSAESPSSNTPTSNCGRNFGNVTTSWTQPGRPTVELMTRLNTSRKN